jgi:predicted nucleotidyltransferase component of viral defense system
MDALSGAQVAELVHIAFLDVLSKRVDQSRYVLKGGANLRYFFGSVRYSEDMDLDVAGIPGWRLAEKVGAIFSSMPMQSLLRTAGLTVAESSNPKQTETTQRWKLGVEAAGHSDLVRTRIEFSYRDGDRRLRLEPVDGRIVAPYALRPPSVQHYLGGAALEQKVRALAGRSETQARDVFDLDLLLRRQRLDHGGLAADLLTRAADRALELPFAAFRDQVLPFLELEVVELYEGEEPWLQMQAFVAERLEEAR